MVNFFYETDFRIASEERYREWVVAVVVSEGYVADDINYIFCDDDYLLEVNKKYLNHDTYTDIITFDNSEGKNLRSDIFISVERVAENAKVYGVSVEEELHRVMAHGVLHLSGYGDKNEEQSALMRVKEEEKMEMFHVEQ